MKQIITLLLLLISLQLCSQVIYVDSSASGLNLGTSWTNAFNKMQDGLAKADSGYQVWVAKGTYYPDEGAGQINNSRDASFYLKNNVKLYGGFAGTETASDQRSRDKYPSILSGEIQQDDDQSNNTFHVVQSFYLDRTALLDGFTITGGHTYLSGNQGFVAGSGAGMFNYYSSPTINACTFSRNIAEADGGGMFNHHSAPLILNSVFVENSSAYVGGGMKNFYSTSTINNCIFWRNSSSTGGAIYNVESSVGINNCTFSQNSSASGKGGGIFNNFSSPHIYNCIFWGNPGGEIIDASRSSTPVVAYSIIQGSYWNGSSLTGVLFVDPLFVNANGGDLRLKGCSPAINRGDNWAVTTTVDLNGQPRIGNGQVDMGAYEYTGRVYVKFDATGKNNGTSWDNAYTSLQYALLRQDTCRTTQLWVARGTYYPTEIITDRSASFVMKKKVEIYGGFGGNETVITQRNLFLYKSILSGDIDRDGTPAGNTYHVLIADSIDYSVVVDGFTITGGNANGSEMADKQGGGIRISFSNGSVPAPRIQYCTFEKNAAEQGGGIYITASFPSISWSKFNGNTATTGGAIYNGGMSQSTVLNSRFIGNTAANGGAIYNDIHTVISVTNGEFFYNTATGTALVNYKGGAIYNSGAYNYLMNCSFSANAASAGYGGAIYNENSSPNITNAILWANSSEINGDANSHPAVTYSIVQDGYEGTGNLDQDPLFVYALFEDEPIQDLSTRLGSAAFDAGTDDGIYFTDLNGSPRTVFLHTDMGVYEMQRIQGPPGHIEPLTLGCPQDFIVNSSAGECGTVVSFTGAFAAVANGGVSPIDLAYSHVSGTLLPVGKNIISVTATDNEGTIKTCSFTITVLDHTAPLITVVSATPAVLYPPNHQMQNVRIDYAVAEACVVTTTLSVASNESTNGTGDVNTSPDWQVIDDHHVRLRAERSGNGTGRIYTITITATDSAGNTAIAATTVSVPHNNGKAVTTTPGIMGKEELIIGLKVQAMPNPTTDGFTIMTQSSSLQTISIQVTDNLGRNVERRTGVPANGTIYLGNQYRPGMYFMEIIQSDNRQTIKLLKKNR